MSLPRCLTLASLWGLLSNQLPAQGLVAHAIPFSARVVSSSSGPIFGAVVNADGSAAVTTDSDGVVRLVLLEGMNLLHVRALGFVPLDTQFVATPQGVPLLLRLQSAIPTLATVTISASGTQKPARYAETTRFDEFYERRHTAVGGTFFSREEIEQTAKQDIIDVLRGIAGVKIELDRFGLPSLVFTRCKTGIERRLPADADKTVQLFVDGRRVGATSSTLQMMKTSDVEAMEVYQGVSALPQAARGDGCGAIFIWTRYNSSAP